MPWMKHAEVKGDPVPVSEEQYRVLYKSRGWELTDRPLDFGETPVAVADAEQIASMPPPPVDPEGMTRDELLAEAKNRQVDVPSGAVTKKDIAEAINAAPTQPATED